MVGVALVGTCPAAATPAGSRISNTARLTIADQGGSRSVSSNAVDLIVAERLDVTLTRPEPTAIAADAATARVTMTNGGNGEEAFAVAATIDAPGTTVRAIAIDRDGDGRFDPAVDTLLDAGRTPVLAAGASAALLVVLDQAAAGTLTVTAHATTGSGLAGTAFVGRGDGGGDAVVGPTGAAARLDVPLGEATGTPTLVKTQAVLAPDGSATPVSGAVVTYTITAHLPAATAEARIADPIPAGTAYRTGSLRLDGQPLSDAADGDAGTADAGGIAVDLGAIARPADRTVRFQVIIQ